MHDSEMTLDASVRGLVRRFGVVILRNVIVASAVLAVTVATFGALQARAVEYLRVHFDRDMVSRLPRSDSRLSGRFDG